MYRCYPTHTLPDIIDLYPELSRNDAADLVDMLPAKTTFGLVDLTELIFPLFPPRSHLSLHCK